MIFEFPVFFHEDNFCQIELLPIQNILIKRNEVDLAQEHSHKNYTSDGFIKISNRSQVKYSLTELRINCDNLKIILKDEAIFYFDKVYTGYSTQRTFKENIHGFGFENYILYYEFENNMATKFWIDYNLLSDTLNCYPEKLQNALFKLGSLYDLILVDWNELITVILRNKLALLKYVKETL
jgi:hypothetical protein